LGARQQIGYNADAARSFGVVTHSAVDAVFRGTFIQRNFRELRGATSRKRPDSRLVLGWYLV